MSTSEDLFRLFEANANGMEEFARLSGEVSQRRRVARAVEITPIPVAAPVALEEPRRPWWERVGLVPAPKKRRRRLTAMPQGLAGVSSHTS